MSGISNVLVNQLKTLLHEGIQGLQKDWSYFTDPDSKGFLGTIEKFLLKTEKKVGGVSDSEWAKIQSKLRQDCFITQTASYYNVQCLEDSTLAQISYNDLEQLYNDIPKLERL